MKLEFVFVLAAEISFRLNSLGPLCVRQCFVLSLEQGSVIVGSLRRLGGDISVKGAAGWD